MSEDRAFHVVGLAHVGVASKDPEMTRRFFRDTLGLVFLGDEEVASQRVLTSLFDLPTGGPQPTVEVLAATADDSPIAQFVAKRGGGIHHVALTVDDLDAAVASLRAGGVKLLSQAPGPGIHGTRTMFIHPHATGGVLVELVGC